MVFVFSMYTREAKKTMKKHIHNSKETIITIIFVCVEGELNSIPSQTKQE